MKILQSFFYLLARLMAFTCGLVVILFGVNKIFKTDFGLWTGPAGNRSFTYAPENWQDLLLWLFLLGGVGLVSYVIEKVLKNSGWLKSHPGKAPLLIVAVMAALGLVFWGIISYGNSMAAENTGGNFLNAIYEKKSITEISALSVHNNDFGQVMSYNAFDTTVRSDYFTLMPVLVEQGYDINAQTRELYKGSGGGQTVLMQAVEANSAEAVQTLLDNGARTDLVDSQRKTALHYAANSFSEDKTENILLLLKAKADPNAQDYNGETALHVVLKNSFLSKEQFDMVKTLVNAGAELDIKDKNGNTPRKYVSAAEYQYTPGQPLYYQELHKLFKK